MALKLDASNRIDVDDDIVALTWEEVVDESSMVDQLDVLCKIAGAAAAPSLEGADPEVLVGRCRIPLMLALSAVPSQWMRPSVVG